MVTCEIGYDVYYLDSLSLFGEIDSKHRGKETIVGTKVFDHIAFMQRQTIDALTCPVNRDWTRREHQCDDWMLYQHPDWLIEHYIRNSGAVEFAKHRADFFWEIETPDRDYEI